MPFKHLVRTTTFLTVGAIASASIAQTYYPQQYSQPAQTYSTPGNVQPQVVQGTNVILPWSQALLKNVDVSHDFGAVPTASTQEHVFEFVNSTDSTLNLLSARASCGCTKPSVVTPIVKPGETAKILARFDTWKFRGQKQATVTVAINKLDPNNARTQYGEVQFSVRGKIRQDVVLDPGTVEFGNVESGTPKQQSVTMRYAGDPRWQILKVESTNPNVNASVVETQREGGRVAYQLNVSLSDAQAVGTFRDELTIFTNDRESSQMPIVISGQVQPSLEASPIRLGLIKQNEPIKKRFIVRGKKAFKITGVQVGDDRIQFTQPTGEKSLHVLEYTLDTSMTATINSQVTVLTSDPDHPQKTVEFSARIVDEAVAEN